MNIGKKILDLRKEKNMTQEQLAAALNVSTAAVSKWETQIAYPDIEMLPKMASLFNVSIDMLLDYTQNLKTTIDDAIEEASLLAREGKKDEAIALLTETLYRYPNEYRLKFEIARHKHALAFRFSKGNAKRQALLEEARLLFSKVSENYTNTKYKKWAKYFTAQIYDLQGNHKKALDLLEELVPEKGLYPRVAKVITMLHMHDGNVHKEMLQAMADNIFEYDYLNSWLIYELLYIENNPQKVIDEATKCINVILAYTKDQADYLDSSISENYEACAFAYAKLKDFDKCLDNLELACRYAVRFDEQNWKFTETLYGMANEFSEISKTNASKSMLMALNSNERDEYAQIRETERFKAIITKLEKHAKL